MPTWEPSLSASYMLSLMLPWDSCQSLVGLHLYPGILLGPCLVRSYCHNVRLKWRTQEQNRQAGAEQVDYMMIYSQTHTDEGLEHYTWQQFKIWQGTLGTEGLSRQLGNTRLAETNNAQVNTTTNHRTSETRQVMARQETLTIHYTIKDSDSHIMTTCHSVIPCLQLSSSNLYYAMNTQSNPFMFHKDQCFEFSLQDKTRKENNNSHT